MESVLLEILVGLVAFLVGREIHSLVGSRTVTQTANVVTSVVAFVLVVGAYLLATKTSYTLTAAVLGFLALTTVEHSRPLDRTERRMASWFGERPTSVVEGVILPTSVTRRMLARLADRARRQGDIVAKDMKSTVRLGRLVQDKYWLYDFLNTTRYEVPGPRPRKVNLSIKLTPSFVQRDRSGRPVRSQGGATGADPERSPWAQEFWPVVDPEDWPGLVDAIEVEIYQRSSVDYKRRKGASLEVRRVSSGGGSELILGLAVSGVLTLDSEWDVVDFEIRNIPHLAEIPVLHYYAWEVCDGSWDFRCEVEERPSVTDQTTWLRIVRAIPIHASSMAVAVQQRPDFAEVVFHSGDLKRLRLGPSRWVVAVPG